MAEVNYSANEYGRRFRKALSIPFMFDKACSSGLQQFVKTYSETLGCSEKSIFFPLLSCCAACIGPKTHLELKSHWQELPIIWTLVITPTTLVRIDVAEHLKEQLLTVQKELSAIKNESSSPVCNKFIVDDLKIDLLQDVLKNTDGQGIALYSSTRLLQDNVATPRDIYVMRKLHFGSSWFGSSRLTKKLLYKTQMNISVVSSPCEVYQSLATSPNFQELYDDCFLTVCAEENHVKYAQIPSAPDHTVLHRIFREIITLHSNNPLVYKLSEEASQKFGSIHDEISEKAKQMARKNASKVFSSTLSYLGRLSLVLHILDNILDGINFAVPPDPLTWNCEISVDTVNYARQILGYVIEQKFYLAQPTMVKTTPTSQNIQPVTVIDNNIRSPSTIRNNLFTSPQRMTSNYSPVRFNSPAPSQRNYTYNRSPNFNRSYNTNSRQTNLEAFDMLLMSNNTDVNGTSMPRVEVSEIRSAGVAVPTDQAFTPVISSVTSLDNSNASKAMNSPNDLTPHSIALMSENKYLQSFRINLRRFFLNKLKNISLNLCIHQKITPCPTSGFESNEQKISMTRIFLKRLESFGFGTLELHGAKSKFCVFKKKNYNALEEKQRKILTDLRITENDYARCFRFSKTVTDNEQNSNNVVCLE